MVVSQYLTKRRNLLRDVPVVVLCDVNGGPFLDADFVRHITSDLTGDRAEADSVIVRDRCPNAGTDLDEWVPEQKLNQPYLVIVTMTFGPLSSWIEAVAGPHYDESGQGSNGHREIFSWDHRRAVGGMLLEFLDFQEARH